MTLFQWIAAGLGFLVIYWTLNDICEELKKLNESVLTVIEILDEEDLEETVE